jgi:hypothetical protein
VSAPVSAAPWKPPENIAGPIECSPGFPTRCNVTIRAGQKSPFDGVAMTPDLAIFLGQSTEAVQERIDAAVTATAAVWRENVKQARREERADRRVIEVERDAYKRAAERTIWENPAFTGTIAAVAAAILVTVLYVGTGAGERLRDEVAGRE